MFLAASLVIGKNWKQSKCPLIGEWTLTAESEEELRSLLMIVKEESEIVGLKLNIQKN